MSRGYISSGLKLLNDTQSMGAGSENIIITGTGTNQIFKGVTQRTGSPNPVGSKTLTNVGDQYGGLGRLTDTALGSIFRVLGAIFFIGSGRLYYNGADTGATATSTLSLKKITSGSLGTTYQAGLAQPSAPTITAIAPPPSFVGKNDGTVSVKIARVRSATGARSIASLASNVVACRNQSVLVEFPSADLNGQDYWEVDVTLNGYGGIGNHYFLAEVAESLIAGTTVTATATVRASKTITGATNASPIVITATGHGFATNDVITIAGVTGNTAANGTFTITKVDNDTFSLNSSTGNGAYVSEGTARSVYTITLPNGTLTSSNIGYTVESALQWEFITCAGTVGTSGNAKTVVTAAGMTGSPKTITFAVTSGDTPTTVATSLYNALDGDADVTAVFDVYRDGAVVFLKKKSGTDATMNFTLQNDTSAGITEVLSSSTGTINTWVTAVGADGSGGGSTQLITLSGAIGVYPTTTESVTFTKAVSGYKRAFAFEWRDADLAGADLAPIYDYPPPAGLFGGVAGDVVFVDGALGDTVNVVTNTANSNPIAYPGNVIAVSEPARPESFPPSNYIFTNDNPVALLEGSQGLYWRFGKNSLGVIRYIGGSPALSYERIWTGAGIVNQKNVTLGGGGRLYAYTGTRGAVRMGAQGDIDTSFSARVADDMASWTPANVVLGYDANYQYVFYAHNQTILAYFEPMDMWCAPLNLSATLGTRTILAMVTYNSEVYIAAGDITSERAITGATNASPIVITTSTNHGYITGDKIEILNVDGNIAANGTWTVTKLSDTTFSLDGSTGNGSFTKSITGATNATPIEITVSGHGYSTGDSVVISGVGGNTAANGTWIITKTGTDTFTLNTSVGNGTYTTGGTVYKVGATAAKPINLYSFNTGNGTTAKLVTQWQPSAGESDVLSRVRVALRSDATTTATFKAYVNGNTSSIITQIYDVNSGLSVPTTLRPNVRNARIWRVETSLTSAGGDAGFETIVVDGDTSDITI